MRTTAKPDGKYWLGQLRHAYELAVNQRIGDQREFARRLLGPAIKMAEEYVGKSEDRMSRLRIEDLREIRDYLDSMDIYAELDVIEEHNPEFAEAARRVYDEVAENDKITK